MTTGKCRSHLLLKELPFAKERDHYRKSLLLKMERMGIHLKYISCTEDLGIEAEDGADWKSKETKKFAVRFHVLKVSEKLQPGMKTHGYGCLNRTCTRTPAICMVT